ncbi:hypothetical protein PRIPAC_71699, partial [Pristionchus pacificus]|uniref:Uncharacterized protein n=1 Tax=Pristionchus pacificus TaxID=54126 RepID=A0A2A6C862_PRIPA
SSTENLPLLSDPCFVRPIARCPCFRPRSLDLLQESSVDGRSAATMGENEKNGARNEATAVDRLLAGLKWSSSDRISAVARTRRSYPEEDLSDRMKWALISFLSIRDNLVSMCGHRRLVEALSMHSFRDVPLSLSSLPSGRQC